MQTRDLEVLITPSSKTVKIMDEFEGNPTNQKEGYERIILKNCFIVFTAQHAITYRLIIERYKKGAVGDITFSEFKGNKGYEVYAHADSEIKKAINKNKNLIHYSEIQFETPFYLRAQNSGNRTGYGWEWWDQDICFEGTEYGETSDYCFSGVKVELVQSLEDAKKCTSNRGVSEDAIYPKYEGLVFHGKRRYLKIYISETEAVLIENSLTMTVKDMWAIYKNYMEYKDKKTKKTDISNK